MGVYIKGMKMPEGCGECNIPCGINDVDRVLFGFDKTRPQNCPLVEIPEPHGRLIDADKLLSDEQYEKYMRDILIEGETGDLYIRPQDVADLLFDAPAVIEAEGK